MNQTTACTCLPTTHPLASDWKNTPRHLTPPHLTSPKFPFPSHEKKKLQTSPGPGTHKKSRNLRTLYILRNPPPLFSSLCTPLPPSLPLLPSKKTPSTQPQPPPATKPISRSPPLPKFPPPNPSLKKNPRNRPVCSPSTTKKLSP